MNYNDTHTELFDRYLRGESSPEEVAAFENMLAEDKDFAAAFEVHKLLISGIQDHGRQELKNFLKQHTPAEGGGLNSWTGKVWYAAAAVVLVCIGAYIIMQFYRSEQKTGEIAVLSHAGEPVTMDTTDIALKGTYDTESKIAELPKAESDVQMNELAAAEAPPHALTEMPSIEAKTGSGMLAEDLLPDKKEGITVVSEKKLADTLVTLPLLFAVLDEMNVSSNATFNNYGLYERRAKSKKILPANDNTNNDLKQNKARIDNKFDTIEPAAAPSVASKDKAKLPSRTLKVEFWQSPLNFKGYKFSGDLVQLYGLSANNTRLYVLNNIIYVKTGNVIYALAECHDACPYRIETDPETINFINSQN